MTPKKQPQLGVPDIRYIKPRNSHALDDHLKYLTYRQQRSGPRQNDAYVPWIDRGMGGDWVTVRSNLHTHKSSNVLAWTWACSPNPSVFSLIPEDERQQAMGEITERTLAEFYEARGLPPPPFSYVIHNALTKPNDIHPDPLPFTHAHVAVPGTTFDPLTGQTIPSTTIRIRDMSISYMKS